MQVNSDNKQANGDNKQANLLACCKPKSQKERDISIAVLSTCTMRHPYHMCQIRYSRLGTHCIGRGVHEDRDG